MAFEYTQKQKQAIYTRGCNLLVAAAAGSGKTAVLVKRIIELITNIEKPVDIDRLLVVTFTSAAASEMRERISHALYEMLNEAEANELLHEHLRRQIILLNKAQISTLHSFCLNVVRKNFHILDIDPSFKIGDEGETSLIKAQVLEQLFECEYGKEGNDEFFNLVEIYGGKTRDNGLKDLLLEIYSFLGANPWQESWLTESAEAFNISEATDIDNTAWAKVVKHETKVLLTGAVYGCERGIVLSEQADGPSEYVPSFLDNKQKLEEVIAKCDGSFNELGEAVKGITLQAFARSKADADIKKQVTDIRDNDIKKPIEYVQKKFFPKSAGKMVNDLKKLYPTVKALMQLVSAFSKAYAEAKKERNLLDFGDLEHFCAKVLADQSSEKGKIVPTDAALYFREKFVEVLIDEYQDINELQELILTAISKDNPPNRFMVGDIKQSIYKFRQAKPELFMQKYREFSDDINSLNQKIDLSGNFRSRKIVINAVNAVFMQLMSEEMGGVCYDDRAALYYGANFMQEEEGTNISTDAEVLIVGTSKDEDDESELFDFTKAEFEAKAIARRIDQLVNGEDKLFVFDKDKKEYRPATFSDIVIIVRSASTTVDVIASELERVGIPTFANSSGDFFSSLEIMTTLSFLQVIDNPLQDIHLIAVLYSPVYGVTSDELVQVRSVQKEGFFYNCVKSYLSANEAVETELSQKLNTFLTDLEKWRRLSTYVSTSQLMDTVLDDTGYYNYVGVMPIGKVRQANIAVLKDKAVKFEETTYKGLFHFIKYMEKLQKAGVSTQEAKLLSENDDVVRIMTIHKSKGLEFPIVFVSMLGKQFNREDEKRPLILHQEMGLGPYYVDLENRTKTGTIIRSAISRKIYTENMSEELRNLYVALTRAREKLILTGTVSDIEKSMDKWNAGLFVKGNNCKLPIHFMLNASSFLDWIMYAILRHNNLQNEDSGLFKLFLKTAEEVLSEALESENEANDENYNEAKFSVETSLSVQNLKIENNEKYKVLDEKLLWEYPFKKETGVMAKVSISEIKRNYQRQLQATGEEYSFYTKKLTEKPSFLSEEKGITGAQLGTAIHTVMEHLDISLHTTAEAIESLIKSLVGKLILNEKEASAIPIEKIYSFTASALAQRMRASSQIKTEVPFVMGVSPYEIYFDESLKDSKATVLVHGIIDCFFFEGDEVVIVDYKSDYVKNVQDIVDRYKIQLMLYKKSVEQSTGKKVKECVLYLFGIDDFVIIQ